MAELSPLTARLRLIVDEAGFKTASQAGTKLGTALAGASSRTSQLASVLSSVVPSSVAASGALANLSAGTLGYGAALAGVGVIVQKSVGEFVQLAGEVRRFALISGATAEESSRFIAVLDDFGISGDTASRAIGFLARNIDDADKKLRPYGAAVARSKSGTADLTETLLNVADAYAATSDPARRAELVFGAFGRQGQALVPVLAQGRAGLAGFFAEAERHGQLFNQEDLDKARELELAIDELQDGIRGFALAIGRFAVPFVVDLIDFTNRAIGKVEDLIDKISSIPGIPNVGDIAGSVFGKPVHEQVDAEIGPDGKLRFVPEGKAKADAKDAAEALQVQQESADTAAKALFRLDDAEAAVASSSEALSDAVTAAADAQADYEEIVNVTGKAAKALEAAERSLLDAQHQRVESLRSLADAERTLRDATESASEAQREHNELLASEAERATRSLERATLDLAQAQERVADSTGDVEAKQKALAEAVAAGASPNRLRKLREELADAGLGRRDAELDVRDQQDKVTEAQRQKREGTDALTQSADKLEQANRGVEQAERGLESARRDVDVATRGVADATERYNDALSNVGPNSEAAKLAAERVRDANDQVKAASRDAAKAQTELGLAHEVAAGGIETETRKLELYGEALRRLNPLLATHLGLLREGSGLQSTLPVEQQISLFRAGERAPLPTVSGGVQTQTRAAAVEGAGPVSITNQYGPNTVVANDPAEMARQLATATRTRNRAR